MGCGLSGETLEVGSGLPRGTYFRGGEQKDWLKLHVRISIVVHIWRCRILLNNKLALELLKRLPSTSTLFHI